MVTDCDRIFHRSSLFKDRAGAGLFHPKIVVTHNPFGGCVTTSSGRIRSQIAAQEVDIAGNQAGSAATTEIAAAGVGPVVIATSATLETDAIEPVVVPVFTGIWPVEWNGILRILSAKAASSKDVLRDLVELSAELFKLILRFIECALCNTLPSQCCCVL